MLKLNAFLKEKYVKFSFKRNKLKGWVDIVLIVSHKRKYSFFFAKFSLKNW